MLRRRFNTKVSFMVNGHRHTMPTASPNGFLLETLRDLGYTGAKLACGEGGCGACTVTITTKTGSKAVNACLFPLAQAQHTAITTVEGLSARAVHPVSTAMEASFGSQCGFCTPGFVMAMYTKRVEDGVRDPVALAKALDGNLCRCTGYRAIAEAVSAVAKADAMLSVVRPPDAHDFGEMPLVVQGEGSVRCSNVQWFFPSSLADALVLLNEHKGSARLVAGNTELGVEQRFKGMEAAVLISLRDVAELTGASVTEEATVLPAGQDLESLRRFLSAQCKEYKGTAHAHRARGLQAILDQLFWFAGTSIRNVATLGGNIATASPISDLNPVWMALGATFQVASVDGQRMLDANAFFTGYRKTALRDNEMLIAVHVPHTKPNEVVHAFKQAQRREDDIAIVTACIRGAIDSGVVQDCSIAFGGMAPTTIRAPGAEKAMQGLDITSSDVDAVVEGLGRELALPANVPGGRPEYRTSLAQAALYKWCLRARGDKADPRELSTLLPIGDLHSVPRGEQVYQKRPAADAPVGESVAHTSARRQTTGDALYTDDLPRRPNELVGLLVGAKTPGAVVKRIDVSRAAMLPGVHAIYTAKDVPGDNLVGDIFVDEPIFIEEGQPVQFLGQPVAIVVADTQAQARRAMEAVDVTYGETSPVLISVDDAVAAESWHNVDHTIERGDVDAELAAAPHRASGRVRIGGQEHFYFEPMVTLAEPVDGTHEMTIYSSTQNLNKTQHGVATVLGVPMNRVSAQVRRLGGGFGGKETANIVLSCAAAIAAHNARRPVRLVLSRDDDMRLTGKRHPFVGEYNVAFDDQGVVRALDVNLISNGGYSFDLSGPVVDRALLHSDNAYFVPAMRARGRVAKTHLPSNTAFRGFGGPQGMLVAEHWIEHIARTLNLPTETVRERNLYASPQGGRASDARRTTHYGQLVTCDMPALWERCAQVADVEARRASIQEYNAAHKWRKRGLAQMPSKFGIAFTFTTLNQATSLVHIYTDGSVLVNHGGTEMGQGLHTKVQQIAAHVLGVSVADVHVQDSSTEKVANASPTAASAGSDLYGMATQYACEELAERLAPYRKGKTFREAVFAAYLDRVNLSAQGFYKTPVTGWNFDTSEGTPFQYFTSGAACTEVELDVMTGDWRALRSDIVMDVGTSINPGIDIGQIEGAFVQGQGWLTTEDYIFGGKEHVWLSPGTMFAPGPGSYKMPTMDCVPREMNVHLMRDVADSPAVYSSRGVGEPPLCLSGSVLFALRDAVYNARAEHAPNENGLLAADAPLTTERLGMACKELAFRAKGNF